MIWSSPLTSQVKPLRLMVFFKEEVKEHTFFKVTWVLGGLERKACQRVAHVRARTQARWSGKTPGKALECSIGKQTLASR